MTKYQYAGQGHTLIKCQPTDKEKTTVPNGETVDIDDQTLWTPARLMLAGFQKVADGLEDIGRGAAQLMGVGENDKTEDPSHDGIISVPPETPTAPVMPPVKPEDLIPTGNEGNDGGEPADETMDQFKTLMKNTRDQLEAMAAERGIEGAADMPNKDAIVEAIIAHDVANEI